MKDSRNTVQRRVVLETVQQLNNHPTAEEVFEEARKRVEGMSLRTVYRNLNLLAERGEIRKVRSPSGADRDDFTLSPNHHIRCRACGRVSDVDMPAAERFTDRILDAGGYLVEGYDIVFTGLCPDCQTFIYGGICDERCKRTERYQNRKESAGSIRG